MLDFLSIFVPDQLQSHWTKVHLTTERILVANPTIVNYWIHIHRDDFYHRYFRSIKKIVNNDWMRLLTSNHNISANDIHKIYQFIRTSIHIVINNDNCLPCYYAQTKQTENNEKITIISLSDRLFQSNSDAYIFVAAAVLLREISRAIWPACLKNTRSTQFLQHPIFFSWTGIPIQLWPNEEKKRKQDSKCFSPTYISHPSDGKTSLVSDAGNLFQHLFYNGEVHLYDDEIDDRDETIIVHVALRVHQTSSSLCAARYLNDKLLYDFFNTKQYSLESIRLIKDQPCPYFQYYPIEARGSRIDDIVVDDNPHQRTNKDSALDSNYNGPFYEYKPYDPKEPRQHYEQTLFRGLPSPMYRRKCIRVFEHVIQTDDSFFLENRLLFRRSAPIFTIIPLNNMLNICTRSSPIRQQRSNNSRWCQCIRRLQSFYNKCICKDNN